MFKLETIELLYINKTETFSESDIFPSLVAPSNVGQYILSVLRNSGPSHHKLLSASFETDIP